MEPFDFMKFLTICFYIFTGVCFWYALDFLYRILVSLDAIREILEEEEVAAGVEFYATINGINQKVNNMILKANEKALISAKFKDKFGNDALIDGKPSWHGDENLAEIIVSEDGLSAQVKAKGPVGSFQLQCSADADLGEGQKAILGEIPVEIIAAEAERIELSAGPAEPQA